MDQSVVRVFALERQRLRLARFASSNQVSNRGRVFGRVIGPSCRHCALRGAGRARVRFIASGCFGDWMGRAACAPSSLRGVASAAQRLAHRGARRGSAITSVKAGDDATSRGQRPWRHGAAASEILRGETDCGARTRAGQVVISFRRGGDEGRAGRSTQSTLVRQWGATNPRELNGVNRRSGEKPPGWNEISQQGCWGPKRVFISAQE